MFFWQNRREILEFLVRIAECNAFDVRLTKFRELPDAVLTELAFCSNQLEEHRIVFDRQVSSQCPHNKTHNLHTGENYYYSTLVRLCGRNFFASAGVTDFSSNTTWIAATQRRVVAVEHDLITGPLQGRYFVIGSREQVFTHFSVGHLQYPVN